MSRGKVSEAEFAGYIQSRPEIRLFLVYGKDESAIASIAAAMAANVGAGAEAVDLESDKLRGDPALLADEAASTSLFGDIRYIRLNFRRDEAHDAVDNLLSADAAGNVVIATAGDLTKASKLLKLVDASPHALSYICYQPSEAEATDQVLAMARAAGLKLDRTLAAQIAHYTGQDRRLAASEIDKLALYHDASPDRPALVERDAFAALAAETNEENISALVNRALGGELRELGGELADARAAGVDAIRIIRALQRRVSLLAGLRGKVDGGAEPGALIRATRSIFWKEQDAHSRQLKRWTSARLSGLNAHLLDLEKKLMSVGGDLGEIILEQELVRIARAAAKAR